VAVSGVRAQELVAEVLLRINPQLPQGIEVEMTRHRKWLTLQRVAAGDMRVGPFSVTLGPDQTSGHTGKTAVRAVGAWIPFLPRKLRARLAAQDVVETVLEVAYAWTGGSFGELDCDVQARSDGDLVRVSYRRPDETDPTIRVELDPLPIALL
jgi:hypothetical protein